MNLPKTGFPMRAGLSKSEPKRLKDWQDNKVYEQVLKKNEGHKKFVLHDGPPYANGPIHIGHAMNKISKDMINRYWMMQGYEVPYVPGWDCHGQPIEHKVEEKLGTEKFNQTPTAKIRELCNEFAVENIELQKAGFRRLGVLGDWDNPYLTLYHQHDAADIEVFKAMFDKGMIYRGHKPVHWCKHCHTALAEAEIEYSDETSPSIFVRFEMTSKPAGLENFDGPVDFIIWTTTPWTIPSDQAVSLKPGAAYVAVEHEGRAEVMLEDLAPKCCEEFGWEYTPVMVDGKPYVVPAETFHHIHYKQPIFDGVEGVALLADYVGVDDGTGIVHNSPGHGVDDYFACLKEGITDICMPVDDDGKFYTGEEFGTGGPFSGMDTDEANPHIIEFLRERGTLVLEKKITHSYPHCWRCHEPVIFRATDQWFVSMDKNALREDALRAINSEVEWIPAWAKNRIGAMVADRPDWCISRQRSWGVPIPVFKCAKCGNTVAPAETFDAVIELFNTKGADAWFTEAPSDYLPRGTKCEVCGGTELIPEKDILDVWWESGVSHTSVCRHRAEADGLTFPADMYLEGSDQHRGWFQSSLLTSIGAYGVPPYRSVMHCGFTVDEEGRKMSKSLGNGIDPEEMCNKFGADVLRLWVSSCDYSQDVSISENILKQVSDAYRRFRNTFRFLLGNLNDFTPDDFVGDWDALEPLDQWAMVRLSQLLADVEAAYESYRFNSVYRALYDYVNDISAVYMDVTKDRLYAEAPASPRRRAAQTVLMNILEVLVRVMAPILSFTTDEVWECYPPAFRDIEGREASVQLAGWPTARDFVPALPADAGAQVATMEEMMAVREVVTKALEEARNEKIIGKSQEASLTVTAPAALVATAGSFDPSVFEELFIVASVQFVEGDGDEITAAVAVAEGEKCPRCWNIRELGGNPDHPDVCERCGDALDAIEGGAE